MKSEKRGKRVVIKFGVLGQAKGNISNLVVTEKGIIFVPRDRK